MRFEDAPKSSLDSIEGNNNECNDNVPALQIHTHTQLEQFQRQISQVSPINRIKYRSKTRYFWRLYP